jgi:hypothetical protein
MDLLVADGRALCAPRDAIAGRMPAQYRGLGIDLGFYL